MKVRVTSVFVMKFISALNDMLEKSGVDEENWNEGPSVPMHLAVEEFLEAMAPALAYVLKPHLLEVLLAETAAGQSQSTVPNIKTVLDSAATQA